MKKNVSTNQQFTHNERILWGDVVRTVIAHGKPAKLATRYANEVIAALRAGVPS